MAELRLGADDGVFVLGGLTRLLVVLAVLAVAVIDAVSVGTTALQAADAASTAASDAALVWRQTHDVHAAYAAATADVRPTDTLPPSRFVVSPDGSIDLVLKRTATTVLLRHIGPLRHFAVVSETGHAPPATG